MAPKSKDYYQILGLNREASSDEIKRTYRKLAIQYHPDKNPGDTVAEDRFKEIAEAYEILGDAEKRQRYDRYGYEGVKGAFRGGGFSWEDFHHAQDFDDIFGDLLGNLFGFSSAANARGGRTRARGRDLRVRLDVTLQEILHGKDTELTLKRLEPCKKCEGSGVKPGSKAQKCLRCAGVGQIRISQGFFQLTTNCDVCHGRGEVIKDPCPECQGEGRVNERVTINLHIPRGIDNGTQLRVIGEGEAGQVGTGRGDLYVVLSFPGDERYERAGYDLHCEQPISFVQAAMGDEMEIETPWGPTKLRIPPGTQHNDQLKIPNYGIPRSDSDSAPRGQIFAHVRVQIPKKLTDKQKEILRDYARESGEDRIANAEDKGFFDRMKDSIGDFIGKKEE